MKILKMIKIDYRDGRIIRELYKHQTIYIYIYIYIYIKESKKGAAIRKGVRQGCNMWPFVFNMYIEQGINECK